MFDYCFVLVWLQLISGDNQDMIVVIELVDLYIVSYLMLVGIEVDWVGKVYLNVVWQENMVVGMFDSLLGVFVMVFIMMVLLFCLFVYGVLVMLLFIIIIIFIYGLIGIVGKDYDMLIVVLFVLMFGLLVDFVIYFLEWVWVIFNDI